CTRLHLSQVYRSVPSVVAHQNKATVCGERPAARPEQTIIWKTTDVGMREGAEQLDLAFAPDGKAIAVRCESQQAPISESALKRRRVFPLRVPGDDARL